MCIKGTHVDRISINPQTMNQQTLDLIGRRHTVEQIEEAFALAGKAGLDNINMDMILGLPGENKEMVQHTLEKIKALAPESLTVHSLAIKRAAALNIWRENIWICKWTTAMKSYPWRQIMHTRWDISHIICIGRRIWRATLKMWVTASRGLSVFTTF